MATDRPSSSDTRARADAFRQLARGAAANIPGAELVSITLNSPGRQIRTVAATHPLAEQMDALQYELQEGPCYAAVTAERFVISNDISHSSAFPRYAARAVEAGVLAHAAIQLIHNGDRAGLNLYARTVDAFDRSSIQMAEMFAGQAAVLLEYAEQVEHLNEALHSRTDIGIATGMVMERFQVDRRRAFAFLVRASNNRNIKLRALAVMVIDGSFSSTTAEDDSSHRWP